MKIRTSEQLLSQLDTDFGWRLKEIHILKGLVKRSRDLTTPSALRASIPLLYAHWEGFVKNASESYVLYVGSQRRRHSELTSNFVALAAKRRIEAAKQSGKSHIHQEMVDFFVEQFEDRADLTFEEAMNTESNLSSTAFENIASAIGVDFSFYRTKGKLIDERLLRRRNKIAHGEFLEVGSDDFVDLANETLTLLRQFKDDILNAMERRDYLRR